MISNSKYQFDSPMDFNNGLKLTETLELADLEYFNASYFKSFNHIKTLKIVYTV